MALQKLFIVSTVCFGLVQAQGTTVYQRPDCRPDSANHLRRELNFPSVGGGDQCTQGSIHLPGWPTTPGGDYIIYYDANGIAPGCRVAIMRQLTRNTDFCGIATALLTGGSGGCQEGLLPVDYNIAHCCDDQNCEPIFPPGSSREESAVESSYENITDIKRSPLLRGLNSRQDACRWEGGAPFESFGAQQIIAEQLDCTPGTGATSCSITEGWSVTIGSSNSFQAGAEVTVSDIFSIVQASVSFSYTYTFEESRTETTTHEITVPPGQSGFGTFTPFTECTVGTWVGNCDGLENQGEGEVCVPVNTIPRGRYSFVAT